MSTKEILEKLIKDGEDAKAKLKEIDEPKPRNGDYGRYKDSGNNWWYWKRQERLELFGSHGSNGDKVIMYSNMIKEGNHVDDMKRNGEDLDALHIEDADGYSLAVRRYSPESFCIEVKSSDAMCAAHFDIKELILIHQSLGRIIATVKRSQDD